MKNETVLITGASSGIGYEMAKQFSRKGYDLIVVARRKDRLEKLAGEIPTNCQIITADLAQEDACYDLYEQTKDEDISILVNCAGFGLFGEFNQTDLDTELQMIDVNIKALHILTKLYLNDFVQKNKGYILNVASAAGLMPAGPYMAAYYATKAYVTSLTSALSQELADMGSNVYIGALCPGPVDTEFNAVAGASFALKSITVQECAMYGIGQMFKRRTIIVPDLTLKAAVVLAKIAPRRLVVKMAGYQQKKKRRMA